jgi:acyl-CoA synthetase (NDP forming)
MRHRLDPLLRPGSIAVVGATQRDGAVGKQILENLTRGRFAGRLYAVNPNYDTVADVPCYPSLAALPEPVEHVMFAVRDERMEAALAEAVEHGAAAVTIMSSLVLEQDAEPRLRERVAQQARDAGLLVCGGNGMGFYNFVDHVWACGFATRAHEPGGNVALISHSGSGMSGIVDVDERIHFNLAVSTGQELTVAMDDYLDFALELPGTRVVGLFMETVRNPAGMRAALEKANRKGIPIVALKVGRTELAARLTVSHSGALAGRDASYDALFDRYGVQRVNDMDELATTLIMFAQPHGVAAGGLVSLHDSGGERQLTIDLAAQVGAPLAQLGAAATAELASILDPGLPAVNPLDAWGTGGADFNAVMARCLSIMLADPGAALGAVIHDRAPEGSIYPDYLDYLRGAHEATGKPVFLVANRQGTGADPIVLSATREGFPVLDGLAPFLTGVRCLIGYRDFQARPDMAPEVPPAAAVAAWGKRLISGPPLDEQDALRLLDHFGVPANCGRVVEDQADALEAAASCGFPVALKTAAPEVAHKSDVAGVCLDLSDAAQVASAYQDLSSRLGPRVLVVPMVQQAGVEMLLGAIHDEQFGPVVLLGFGGVLAESLNDVVSALPPFDPATARRLIDSLRLRPLLDGGRGRPAADLDAYCAAAARFSSLIAALGEFIAEADVNPILVHEGGAVALDALIVPRT